MRRTLILTVLLLVVVGRGRPTLLAQTAADSSAIRETALNYVEGWYEGSAERMTRVLWELKPRE